MRARIARSEMGEIQLQKKKKNRMGEARSEQAGPRTDLRENAEKDMSSQRLDKRGGQ